MRLPDNRLVTGGGRFGGTQPGGGYLQLAHFGDGGAQHPGEPGLPSADVDPRHPARLVGDGSQVKVDRSPRQQVPGFGAVAPRPHPVPVGALPVVHRHRPGVPRRHPRFPGQLSLRAKSQAEHHHLRRMGFIIAPHAGHPLLPVDALHPGSGHHPDAHFFHRLHHPPSQVGVHGAVQHRLPGGEHGGFPTPDVKSLRRLQPHVSSSHHHRIPRPPISGGPQQGGVVQGVQPVHAGQVRPIDGGAQRAGAGSDHQLVVAEADAPPAVQVGDFHGAAVQVDGLGLMPGANFNAHFRKGLGSAGHQLFQRIHVSGYVIGLAAGRITHPVGALQGDDFQVRGRPAAPGLGGGGHPGGVPADDDQPFHDFP